MADVTVVANEVLPESGVTRMIEGIAGATITAGQLVYLDTSAGTYKLADANASAATSVVAGIAMNSCVANQAMRIAAPGPDGTTLDPGFTVTVGSTYWLSATAGGITLTAADLVTGMYPVVIGVGITASQLKLQFVRGTAAIP